MSDKEVLWEALVEHKKTEYVPSYSPALVASVGGKREWWENGKPGGGFDDFGVAWEGTESAGGAGVPLADPIVLEDITTWEDTVHFPDVDKIPWKELAEEWLAGVDRYRKFVDYFAYNAQYERVTHLMGFMEGLCAFSEEPEAAEALLTAITDYKIKSLERINEYFKPDFYTPFDDVATQISLFISPTVYRELIKPQHKRVNDVCKEMGIVPILHCCGKTEILIEDYIDEGFAGWTSAQPMNDLAGLAKKYGDRIAIIGGYDSNGFPGTMNADDEAVEKEVFRCINEYGGNGGYIFSGFRMVSPGYTREQANGPIINAYAKYRAQFK